MCLKTYIKVVYYFFTSLLPKFVEVCIGLLSCGVADSAKLHGALSTLHVSLNNTSYLHANCPEMIETEQWLPNSVWIRWKYRVWGAMHETFRKVHPKLKTVFELKIPLEKIQNNFPQVKSTKMTQVLVRD